MSNFIYPDILYTDSPFLPPILQDDVVEMTANITQKQIILIDSAVQQTAFIGHALNILHEKEMVWITKSFNCTSEEVLLFYIGFSTPLQMVLSALQMDVARIQTVIKNLTPSGQSALMTKHNLHKVHMLYEAYYIVTNQKNTNPIDLVERIQTMCLKKPFSQNKYYLSGIQSACATITKLITEYQNNPV